MRTPIDGVYVRADTDEYKEKNKKELRHWADGGWRTRRADALRADVNEGKEKEKKRNILKIRGCGRGCLACGWPCVQMVLCADGLACGWSCMQTALHADADGGGYRGGGRG